MSNALRQNDASHEANLITARDARVSRLRLLDAEISDLDRRIAAVQSQRDTKAKRLAWLVNDDEEVPTREIVRAVSERHGVSVDLMMGGRKNRKAVDARHHAMYEILRKRPDLSVSQIAAVFDRDHSSIYAAVKRWRKRAGALGIEAKPLQRGAV